MDNIKFSVIIPAYNVENHIYKTLMSLENQTYKNFEVILVNDGSQDNTLKVIQNFVETSKLEVKLLNQKNEGVSTARNRGINESNGNYIYFLDADDIIENNLIEACTNIILKENPDLVYFKYNKVTHNSNVYYEYDEIYELKDYNSGLDALYDMVNYKIFVGISSSIYKKELIDKFKIYFDQKHISGEDQEFTMKYMAVSSKVVSINYTLFHYIIRKGSITNSVNYKRLDLINAFNGVIDYLLENKKNDKKSELICSQLKNYYVPDNLMAVLVDLSVLEGKSGKTVQKNQIKRYAGEINGYAFNSIVSSLKRGKFVSCMSKMVFLICPKLTYQCLKFYEFLSGKSKEL